MHYPSQVGVMLILLGRLLHHPTLLHHYILDISGTTGPMSHISKTQYSAKGLFDTVLARVQHLETTLVYHVYAPM